MGRITIIKKIKASSLIEVLVATTILLLVFGIALATLQTVMLGSMKKETQVIETKIEKLVYQYKNNQLKIPLKYTEEDWTITIQKVKENNFDFIEFEANHSLSKKIILKKCIANETL